MTIVKVLTIFLMKELVKYGDTMTVNLGKTYTILKAATNCYLHERKKKNCIERYNRDKNPIAMEMCTLAFSPVVCMYYEDCTRNIQCNLHEEFTESLSNLYRVFQENSMDLHESTAGGDETLRGIV